MITTNMRDIKIWKIFEKSERKVAKSCGIELNMPKMQTIDCGYYATVQYIFGNFRKSLPAKHELQINAISTSQN